MREWLYNQAKELGAIDLWAFLRRIDWRIWVLLAAYLLAVGATVIVYAGGAYLDPAQFWGAVFAGWVAGLLLFTVVGAAGAVVSLARPERESFDARARILFRMKSGKHIDYIVNTIKEKLEHYAESSSRKVIVEDYDEAEKKYLLSVETITITKSYIDDIVSTYKSVFKIADLTAPPLNREVNRLTYFRIDGVAVAVAQDLPGKTSLNINTTITRNLPCKIEHGLTIWVKEKEEPVGTRPVRYTQNFNLIIENRLRGNRSIVVEFSQQFFPVSQSYQIAAGESLAILEAQDILPLQKIYEFHLSFP